jgi:hypothetical protein
MTRRHDTSVQEKPRSSEPPAEERSEEPEVSGQRFHPGFWIALSLWLIGMILAVFYELIALVWKS